MSVIPCEQNLALRERIEEYSEVLKVEAHRLGNHGLSEDEFYYSGLFRGAIERIRGQFSATMRDKRDFMRRVLQPNARFRVHLGVGVGWWGQPA
jgi:hypothetical protein